MKREYKILLIDDDFEYSDHLRSLMDEHPSHTFQCERVSLFSKANQLLREGRFDAVLLNFGLKDFDSLDRISELEMGEQDLPIIGLIDREDQDKANDAIDCGLQDQIVKNQHDESIIISKIIFSIKRMEANSSRAKQEILSTELLFEPKTGLPNQILFKDRLEQAIGRADRDQVSVGLLAIHLKHFNSVKEKLGSKISDAILKKVAKLLNQKLRECDTVAYLQDDKFVVVLENLKKTSGAILLAEKIVRAFSRTMHVDEHDVKMTASIGIATYPECKGFHELIKSANWAMKRAGDAGGNRYKLYTDNLSAEAIWKYSLENDLEKALLEQQFELHYQPLFGLKEGGIVGMEALLRWNHPEEGSMLPNAFIDELESSDMIMEVGEWVLDEACRKLKTWQSKYSSLIMGVNLSARQLADPYLLERVNAILDRHGIDPQKIELEITERQLVDKNDAITQYNIKALVDRGINLALDDFGTGYSTESYFQLFPANTIHTLKIDRDDIQGMMENKAIAERVEHYIQFSQDKNLRVIAEGIENIDQLHRLEDLGVDVIQGFLLSKPITGSEIEDGLRRNEFSLDKFRSAEMATEAV